MPGSLPGPFTLGGETYKPPPRRRVNRAGSSGVAAYMLAPLALHGTAAAALLTSSPPVWPAGVRHRARVLYDGEGFQGMQIQPRARTVAGELERALSRRFNRRIQVVAASRTDTGVHARGAAVHFDLPTDMPSGLDSGRLQHSLNAMLPSDMRVHAIEPAPELDEAGRPWQSADLGLEHKARLESG